MAAPSILVAVDFGTTFTGVAHSDPNERKSDAEPVLFEQWREEKDKIPTTIRYDEDPAGRTIAGFKWGLQIKPGQSFHKWFKLELEPTYLSARSGISIDMSQKYPDQDRDETLPNVSAKRLTTDFLRAVCEHVERNIKGTYRTGTGTEPQIRWMMTIPAVWTNEARNTTLECARAAGMGQNLLMTSEPEAAFIYAAKGLPARHKKVGNNIIVLDAGGGTVDLVAYRIRQVDPYLKVEENLVPNGGKCGSVFINRIFERLIDDKLRTADPPLTLSPAGRRAMMNHFENFVKRRFDGEDTEEHVTVPGLPDNEALSISGGMMEISTQEMVLVLDEVVSHILNLVRDQVDGIRKSNSGITAIILVGGFGGSPYLKNRLESDRQLSGIDLVRCNHPATAVVRGAVLKGLQEFAPHRRTVLSRKSICSLGIANSVPFRAGYHPESHKYMYEDSVHKEYLCKDVLSYFVRRNDDLREDVPVSFPLERLVPIDGPFNFTDVVYETYENEPPEILNDTCRALGSLDSDLSDVPSYHFERPGNGDYFKICYTMKATFSAADVKVQLDFNGTNCGSVRLKYGNSALFRPVRRS